MSLLLAEPQLLVAQLTGTGSLSAQALVIRPAVATATGTGTLTATATRLIPATATASGTGSLTAVASVIPGTPVVSTGGNGIRFIPYRKRRVGIALEAQGAELVRITGAGYGRIVHPVSAREIVVAAGLGELKATIRAGGAVLAPLKSNGAPAVMRGRLDLDDDQSVLAIILGVPEAVL